MQISGQGENYGNKIRKENQREKTKIEIEFLLLIEKKIREKENFF